METILFFVCAPVREEAFLRRQCGSPFRRERFFSWGCGPTSRRLRFSRVRLCPSGAYEPHGRFISSFAAEGRNEAKKEGRRLITPPWKSGRSLPSLNSLPSVAQTSATADATGQTFSLRAPGSVQTGGELHQFLAWVAHSLNVYPFWFRISSLRCGPTYGEKGFSSYVGPLFCWKSSKYKGTPLVARHGTSTTMNKTVSMGTRPQLCETVRLHKGCAEGATQNFHGHAEKASEGCGPHRLRTYSFIELAPAPPCAVSLIAGSGHPPVGTEAAPKGKD